MKKVKLNIEVGSNAYCVLTSFVVRARREGWTESEIDKVIDDARSGDYHHLLATIGNRCEQ